MASSSRIVSINQLKEGNEKRTLYVRATRIWDGINNKTGNIIQTNIIFLERQDNQILATIRPYQREQILRVIKEGGMYEISDFKVVPAQTQWKVVNRDLAINLVLCTKIVKIPENNDIPKEKFELMDFSEIPTRVGEITQLLDVIGCLKSMTELETVNKGLKKMDVILVDASEHEAIITLWENVADLFMKLYSQKKDDQIIVAITSTIVKKYKGVNYISTTQATKFYMNFDEKETNRLRTTFQTNKDDSSVQIIPASIQQIDKDILNENRMTLEQIKMATIPMEQDMVICTCEATINDIVEGMGWYYNACIKCFKKMVLSSTTLYCQHCVGSPEAFTQRFKILVQVCDTTGEAVFVMFNNDVENLLGLSIDQVLNKHKTVDCVNAIPTILRNLQGMKCVFQVKITAYNTLKSSEEYSVRRVLQHNSESKKRKSILIEDDQIDDESKTRLSSKIKIEKDD